MHHKIENVCDALQSQAHPGGSFDKRFSNAHIFSQNMLGLI